MKLIGMLDSPYVRRTAIGLKLLGLEFEHQSVSVFSTFDRFSQINPVVKAPTLVTDDGQALMDSTLILDYVATLAGTGARLLPQNAAQPLRAIRLSGLALAACEKTVQIVYERKLRPAEKLHQPWVDRLSGQLLAAYAELEADLARAPLAVEPARIDFAGVTVAVGWAFTQMMLPEMVRADEHPRLQSYSALAEQLPEFASTPAQ